MSLITHLIHPHSQCSRAPSCPPLEVSRLFSAVFVGSSAKLSLFERCPAKVAISERSSAKLSLFELNPANRWVPSLRQSNLTACERSGMRLSLFEWGLAKLAVFELNRASLAVSERTPATLAAPENSPSRKPSIFETTAISWPDQSKAVICKLPLDESQLALEPFQELPSLREVQPKPPAFVVVFGLYQQKIAAVFEVTWWKMVFAVSSSGVVFVVCQVWACRLRQSEISLFSEKLPIWVVRGGFVMRTMVVAVHLNNIH